MIFSVKMKRLILIVLTVSLLIPHSQAAVIHPSLFLSDETLATVRCLTASESPWREMGAGLIERADGYLEAPLPEYRLKGRRLLDVSRTSLARIMALSYARLVTGEEAYSRRAEAEMLAVSAFPDWNPEHFLDVAEMTLGVATGYDWLYPYLSEDSRQTIETAIYEKGLLPGLLPENDHIFISEGNWSQVCNAGLAAGAAAVIDLYPETAHRIIDRALNSIGIAMTASYSPEGVFPEGPMYAAYGTAFNILLVEALRNLPEYSQRAAELERFPGFLQLGYFTLNTTTNSGRLWPYSDCQREGNNHLLQLWFAARWSDKSVLHHFRRQLADNPSSLIGDRYSAAILTSVAPVLGVVGDVPLPAKAYCGSGPRSSIAVLRSGWEPEDLYVGLKGGSPQAGHAHLDAGSVVVEKYGLQWLTDPGMVDYTDIERYGVDLWNEAEGSQRWDVLLNNNMGHTTLTFNGAHMQSATAYSQVSLSPDSISATADLTECYATDAAAVRRAVEIGEDGSSVTITDSIKPYHRFTMVTWTAISEATAEKGGSGRVLLSAPDGRKARLDFESPCEPLSVTVEPLTGIMPYDAPPSGLTAIRFTAVLPHDISTVLKFSR